MTNTSTTGSQPDGACPVCDVVKPDAAVLRDHVLNVHPEDHCGLYHRQPCEHGRRERYMTALLAADPYALVERREDRARLANAVMDEADAEIPAVLRAVADLIDSNSQISAAVHATAEMRRLADEMERTT
jgi:hypothetical protein